MSKASEKRKRLFDLFSANLSLYMPEHAGEFVCPLCLYSFTPEGLAGPIPSLTLAHFVPQFCNGKLSDCTLACVDCNTEIGHTLESLLAERFVAEDHVAGVRRIPARLSGSFGDMAVLWERSPDRRTWSIYGVPERSNPASVKALNKALREGNPSSDFNFSLSVHYDHRPLRVEAAVYQSAFLLLFHYFGYEVVFDPHFAPMRDRITSPDKPGWKAEIAVINEEIADKYLGSRRWGVLFVQQPAAIIAVLRLHPESGQARTFGVVIPAIGSTSVPRFEFTTFRASIIPYDPKVLRTTALHLRKLWHYLQQPPNR